MGSKHLKPLQAAAPFESDLGRSEAYGDEVFRKTCPITDKQRHNKITCRLHALIIFESIRVEGQNESGEGCWQSKDCGDPI